MSKSSVWQLFASVSILAAVVTDSFSPGNGWLILAIGGCCELRAISFAIQEKKKD